MTPNDANRFAPTARRTLGAVALALALGACAAPPTAQNAAAPATHDIEGGIGGTGVDGAHGAAL